MGKAVKKIMHYESNMSKYLLIPRHGVRRGL